MLSSGSRRNIIVFGAGAAAIILVRALLCGSQAADPVTFIACAALLLEWILTVFERVAAKTARRSLLLMGLSFVAFYLLELARTRWFCAGQDTRLPLKYVSFIPVMAAPLALLFFTNSQGVGFDRGPGKLRILYAPLALLALGFVTNGLHFLAMKDPAGGLLSDGDYAPGPLFYLHAAWCAALCLASAMLAARAVLALKKPVWALVIPLIPGAVFFAAYIAAPQVIRIGGTDIIRPADVGVFTAAAFAECCIELGLVRTASGCGELFEDSPLNAAVLNRAGGLAFAAAGADAPTIMDAAAAPVEGEYFPDKSTCVTVTPVRGGRFFSVEDRTFLNEAGGYLERTEEKLTADRALYERMSAIRKERLEAEAGTLIYDTLSEELAPEAEGLARLLEGEEKSGGDTALACLLGGYMESRRKMRFAEKDGKLAFSDLKEALDETARLLRLCGADAEIKYNGEGSLESKVILDSFAFFEEIAASAPGKLRRVDAEVGCGSDHVTMKIVLEPPVSSGLFLVKKRGLSVNSSQEGERLTMNVRIWKGGDRA